LYKIEINQNANINAVRETLSRMGIGDFSRCVLYQSCYLIEVKIGSQKNWYLAHFKELFRFLEGKTAEMTDEDYDRLNVITMFLKNWNLISIKDEKYSDIELDKAPFVTIIKHHDRNDWIFTEKVNLREIERSPLITDC